MSGDGRGLEYTAVATVSEDLTGFVDRMYGAGMEFRAAVKAAGVSVVRAFDVVEVLPVYNPDGSFNHIRLRLRERAGDGDGAAVCEEYGGGAEVAGGCAGGAVADGA